MGIMEKIGDATSAGTREYLTFRLDQEEYGIDILKVQEIRGYEPPTRVADAPPFIKGVVNLRGTIVPIVDMRLKFNAKHTSFHSACTRCRPRMLNCRKPRTFLIQPLGGSASHLRLR